jgi:hypothetical protein
MSKSKRSRVAAAPSGLDEWVVGRVSLPVYVADADPFRPDMIICVSSSGILGSQTVVPEASDDEVAGEVLAFSLAPLLGPPRRPQRIRVASPSLRDALARRFGAGVAITLAPTPEVDALAERFVDDVLSPPAGGDGARGPSYLSGGWIEPALAGGFFEAAARLYRAAPWTIVPSDSDLICIDIPSLGAEGLCVSVIGQMCESFGLVVFVSRDDFERFADVAQRGARSSGKLGTRTLSISFTRLDALPPRMRDEIAAHGFSLGGPEAAPMLMRTDASSLARPLVADDFVLGRIVAEAVARFFERHRAWPPPGAGSIVDRLVLDELPDRPEIVITAAARSPALRVTRRRPPAPTARDLRGVRPTTETAVHRVCGELWGKEFVRRFRDEIDDAMAEIRAVAGPQMRPEHLGDTMGSLPLIWPALWRPMRDGRTGLAVARSWSKLAAPVLAAAVDRLEAARGVYAEVVALTAAGRLLLGDLFDGTIYRMAVPRAVRRQLTRWSRVFGVLVDLGDGSWTFPSVLHPDALPPTPAGVVDAARAGLFELGLHPDDIDPRAPHAGLQACEGLAEAHAAGMVHRDVKPANLFITTAPDGASCVKVLDFGVAKVADEVGLTGNLQALGTPLYMSPEQMQASRAADPRADIWSLAVTLYELLAGKTPFDGPHIQAVCMRVYMKDPEPISTYRADVPAGLEAVIRQALQKERERRFPNMAEFAAALVPYGPPRAAIYAERVAGVLGEQVAPARPTGLLPAEPVESPPEPGSRARRGRS